MSSLHYYLISSFSFLFFEHKQWEYFNLRKMSDADAFTCDNCKIGDRLVATQYLDTVFSQGWYAVVIVVAIVFFMVIARFTYALKLWCMFRGQLIAPMKEVQPLASQKDDNALAWAAAAAAPVSQTNGYVYSLSNALAIDDNKALAVAMAGYMFATGIITYASVSDLNRSDGWMNVAFVFAWQAIGMFLLEITRLITDKLIIPEISLPNEVIKKRNLAAGIVEACCYITSGQVISASMTGFSHGWAVDMTSVAMWFVVGQVTFMGFSAVMRFRNAWSFGEEIANNNAAAALFFGLNKITIGMFLSNAIMKTDSVLAYVVWFTLGTFILISTQFAIDRLVIPGSQLGYEIKHDKNWGASLVVASMVMAVTTILNTFLPETCQNLT